MKPLAIHQYHASAVSSDGITNGMLFTQRLLRSAGYKSEIYCFNVDAQLGGRIRDARQFQPAPNEITLVHYSLGTDHDDWITNLQGPKILVYHNITPAEFFAPGSRLRQLATAGRLQLARWGKQQTFIGAIADSEFNATELQSYGFSSVAAIGLLVDLDHLRDQPWNKAVQQEIAGARSLLFVGRICENKGQLGLVRAFGLLQRTCSVPTRLVLAGGTTSQDYEQAIRNEIDHLGLSDRVLLLGKRPDPDILALYRYCDAFVSMSEHEGFGMPLVEAMAFDLPVVAAAAGSIADTLGCGGLLLDSHKPETCAAAMNLLLEEPWLRAQIITAQRESLGRFERIELVRAFEEYLRDIGLQVDFRPASVKSAPSRRDIWRVEGPFDSSYSLAVVNREFARGLASNGVEVALASRDGPGPYQPDAAFLASQPDVAAMHERAEPGEASAVGLRLQYPPHMADMRAHIRVVANYAWEESGFPEAYVIEFNTCADLVTVASRFVAKTLRDNGVHTPIAVVGYGADQVVRGHKPPTQRAKGEVFRFIHVSSCFPRKGVDVLLAAWGQAFTRRDRVELIIKTFPNIHNKVTDDIAALKATYPDHAPVRLVNEDLPDAAVRELILEADAVVAPSRGEGFCLPLAEALVLGRSVITTAYGGQADFCRPDTAWICDYAFAPAKTHLGAGHSVWVEPDVESLASQLAACAAAHPNERAVRIKAGRDLVLSQFMWGEVARLNREAVARVRAEPSTALRLPRIGWISTWNSKCGIADYSQSLAAGIDSDRLIVLADRGSQAIKADEPYVTRCWEQSREERLDEVSALLAAHGVNALVIQYNFGFFPLAALGRLLLELEERGIGSYVYLHSTKDVRIGGSKVSLGQIASELGRATRIIVHSVHDLNHLKQFGLVDNVTIFPMGVPRADGRNRDALRRKLGWNGNPVIASFGYLLPHTGFRQLIEALAIIRKQQPRARLLMLNALYPAAQSSEEFVACQSDVARLGLEGSVELVTSYMDERAIMAQLGAADLIVYPYQNTQESASAAVKMGLGSLTPVACTPLEIFSDIAGVTHRLPGNTPEEIAAGACELLADDDLRGSRAAAQRDWSEACDWYRLARRLDGLIRGEARMQLLPELAVGSSEETLETFRLRLT